MFFSASFSPKVSRQRRLASAFSLVEVVMAVGLVSFSLLGLLGLLNVGFSSAGQAADRSVQSYIIQTINSEIQLTPATNLPNMNNVTRFFDNQGNEVASRNLSSYNVTTSILSTTPNVLGSNTNGLQVKIQVTSVRHPAKPKISTRFVPQ